MENINQLWVDKYCPTNLDDYVLDEKIKSKFKDMVKNNALQHMTFIGSPGSGKTTLAKILCKESNAETLFVKCATEGTIDTLRTKIQDFCNALSFDDRIKCVILDEIDSASGTGDSNFQKGLRTLIEAHQDTVRFICTANYDKIISAVTSRCTIQELRFGKKDLLLHLKKILDAEKIEYTKESLSDFVLQTFKFYPDCRRIINYMQFCCNSGKLNTTTEVVASSQKDDLIAGIVKNATTAKNILDVRKYYIQNKSLLGDFIEAGSLLFNYVVDNGIVSDSNAILKFTELLYQLNVVIDKEPTFFGMVVLVQMYGKKV